MSKARSRNVRRIVGLIGPLVIFLIAVCMLALAAYHYIVSGVKRVDASVVNLPIIGQVDVMQLVQLYGWHAAFSAGVGLTLYSVVDCYRAKRRCNRHLHPELFTQAADGMYLSAIGLILSTIALLVTFSQ